MISRMQSAEFKLHMKTKFRIVSLVLVSLFFSLTQSAILNGSLLALGFIILTHLYLPGWLLLRALNIKTPNIIIDTAFVLATGVGMIVTIGAFYRFYALPIAGYIVTLHLLMLGLIVFYHPTSVRLPFSSDSKGRMLTQYGLLVLLCIISVMIAIDRNQLRYDLWEDETEFITKINWMAAHPNDHGRYTVQTSLDSDIVDPRYHTDGMTFNYAVWVWASGTSGVDLLWHLITPLFIWLIPLVVFSLAYALSENETHAVYSAAAVVIIGMITLDALAYNPGTAVGRNSFSNLSTLRYFSTGLILPLGQMIFVQYIRHPSRRLVPLLLLNAISLALLHPRQITILGITIGAFIVLVVLQNLRHVTWQPVIIAFAVLIGSLLIPLLQKAAWGDAVTESHEEALQPESNTVTYLSDLPLLNETFVVNPEILVQDPLVPLSIALGVLLLIWKRTPENIFAGGSALAITALLFLPGLAEVFVTLVSARIVKSFTLTLPYSIIWGSALYGVLNRIPAQQILQRVTPVLLAIATVFLYFEPFPIPASAKDQIRVMNELQGLRNIVAADQALIDVMKPLIAEQHRDDVVILAPERSVGFIIEEIPGTLTPTGRSWGNRNKGTLGARRFYNAGDEVAPFLDTRDLEYLNTWDVDYVVMLATHSRVFQLQLDYTHFRHVATVDGYLVFQVIDTTSNVYYGLFEKMNGQLAVDQNPRWNNGTFAIEQAGNPEWDQIRQQWEELASNSGSALVTYGTAFSLYFEGNDAEALPLFRELHEVMPENLTLINAVIRLMIVEGQNDAAQQVLLDAVNSDNASTRIGAAAIILSPETFFVLSSDNLTHVINVVETDQHAWQLLATHQNPDKLRISSALLASRNHFEIAAAWLAELPVPEQQPNDILIRAFWKLALSDTTGALTLLDEALDHDLTASARFQHPSEWSLSESRVRGMYHLLIGEQHLGKGQVDQAIKDLRIAHENGFLVAGMVELARAHATRGDIQQAHAILNELDASNAENASFWATVARLELAQEYGSSSEQHAIMTTLNDLLREKQLAAVTLDTAPRIVGLLSGNMAANVRVSSTATTENSNLVACADFWSLSDTPFPITNWEFTIFDPTTTDILATHTQQALQVDGAIIRWCSTLSTPEMPPYSPVRVIVGASNEPLVSYHLATRDVALNPVAADPADINTTLDYTFGESIHLQGYTLTHIDNQLSVSLFWQVDSVIAHDYNVMVHFLDDDNAIIAQADGPPLNGIYATSQWTSNMLIQDEHTIQMSDHDYSRVSKIRLGLYSLGDLQRVPVKSEDQQVDDDMIVIDANIIDG